MKIGVIGFGVVGKAVATAFKSKGFEVYVNDVESIVPLKNYSKKSLMTLCDYIFICVQTPSKTNGEIDLTYVYNVMEELTNIQRQTKSDPIIILKSTVVPGTTVKLWSKFNGLTLVCNPEFSREKHALQDFLSPDRIVIGTGNDYPLQQRMLKLYEGWSTRKFLTDPTTAEMIKYIANIFFIYKVAYAMEVQRICNAVGMNATEVLEGVGYDKRIGLGYLDPLVGPINIDSPCLPKDLLAFNFFLMGKGVVSDLLMLAYKLGVKQKNV